MRKVILAAVIVALVAIGLGVSTPSADAQTLTRCRHHHCITYPVSTWSSYYVTPTYYAPVNYGAYWYEPLVPAVRPYWRSWFWGY